MSWNYRPDSNESTAGWLQRQFPRRDSLRCELEQALVQSVPLAISPLDAARLGRAFERVIGLDLAQAPPYQDLVGALPGPWAETVLTWAGYGCAAEGPGDWRSWRRAAGEPAKPETLFTAGGVLAELDRLFRRSRTTANLAALVGSLLRNCPDHLRHHCRATYRTRPAFAALYGSYTTNFQGVLGSWGTCMPAPALLAGRRTADFICGSTLVELKTGALTGSGEIDMLLDQLLSYGLLCDVSGFQVTHVAVYLARYEVVLQWEIGEFLSRLAGRLVDPSFAAASLAAIVLEERHHRLAA